VQARTAIVGALTIALVMAAADSIGSGSDDPIVSEPIVSDPIVASFERRHQPAAARRASREAIDNDVLYALVDRALLRATAAGGKRANGRHGGDD